jgi:hypothetical protein
MTNPRLLAAAIAGAMLLPLAGCHVTDNKNGKDDNVKIDSPFGSMHIQTNDAVDTAAIGLTAYPGATAWKNDSAENKNHDNGSANINMSFGDFHLGVKATSLRSTDSQDKILAFYRKDLGRYGDVIECRNNTPVGQPTHTSQGLTCDKDNQNHISTGDSNNQLELRAGSATHQHIVGLESKDGAIKIGLVMLDLPSHLGNHDSKDSE